ncbi:MAG TPA: aminotransferase class I/II-fold pyridoxal phosphate-dependent enzyme [Trueperaceae bacterium]|nr:aminotransferase class I/II-fold pyridoxal phosphate-dependent enzyme [Trueperaceae bacterium]
MSDDAANDRASSGDSIPGDAGDDGTGDDGADVERRTEGAFATRAVRAGHSPDAQTGAHAPPIYQTASFLLRSVEHGSRLRADDPARDTYSRAGNPTVREAEAKLAALEGTAEAVAFASGMGAITALFLSVLRQGDEVLTLGPIYSDTRAVLWELLPAFGITARRVEASELDSAIASNTRLIYVETPSNPTLAIIDLAAVAGVARRHGLLTAADNTFASPYLTRPAEHGIDFVVHSATKYLGGHGDLLAGFVTGNGDELERVRSVGLRLGGASLEPHAAFLLMRGMRTLHLRMAAHCRNAGAVARALETAPGVSRVHYPGLEDHSGHDVATRQMSDFGGMVAVDFAGGRASATRFVERLELFDHAVSLGDVCSLACVSSTTTHASVPPEERARDGITDGLVRLSVGVEDEADLVADVLAAAAAAA